MAGGATSKGVRLLHCGDYTRKNLRPHFAELYFLSLSRRAAQADTILSKWRTLRLDIVFKRRKRHTLRLRKS